jgi:osmotically inducible protein OsmC
MAIRTAKAQWDGNLPQGRGTMSLGSGAWSGQYSFQSRFEEGAGTNPEELIAAAHAGCYSMAFANALAKAGFEPKRVSTTANVQLLKGDAGFSITQVELKAEADVPNIDEAKFQSIAEEAKKGCPISKLISGGSAQIKLDAKLAGR